MIKKAALFFMFIVFIVIVSGCETAKGALKGGIEGAKKNWETAKGAVTVLKNADQWIQKNLW